MLHRLKKRPALLIPLLTLLLVLSLLVACKPGTTPESTDSTPQEDSSSEEESTAPAPDPLTLVKDGKTAFRIVRPTECSETLLGLAKSLKRGFESITGVTVELAEDWVRPGTEPDSSTFEILIGETNRSESKEICEKLRYLDYYSGIVGNKIVIAARKDTVLDSAVSCFLSSLRDVMNKDTGTAVFTDANTKHFQRDYKIADFTLLDEPIESYVIVIPRNWTASEYRTALMFRDTLAAKCGYYLEVLTDNKSTGDREILFGNTARTTVTVGANCFTVQASGTRLEALADSLYTYDALKTYLSDHFLDVPNVRDGVLTVEEAFTFSGSSDQIPELVQNRDGDIRIFFNNCLGTDNNQYPAKQRMLQLSELYLQYLPDVIGLQECSVNARAAGIVSSLTKNGLYREVPVTATNPSKNNSTPLFYRPDVLRLIDCGWHLYSDKANDQSKSITWGVFEVIATGKRFAVCSTHFYYTSDELGNTARLLDAEQLIAVENQIMEKHHVPVFSGGDFNCRTSSQPIQNILNAGRVETQAVAEKTNPIRSYHPYPEYNPTLGYYDTCTAPTGNASASIDHIFLAGSATVKRYEVITELYALLSTDHCPIFVDINLD